MIGACTNRKITHHTCQLQNERALLRLNFTAHHRRNMAEEIGPHRPSSDFRPRARPLFKASLGLWLFNLWCSYLLSVMRSLSLILYK